MSLYNTLSAVICFAVLGAVQPTQSVGQTVALAGDVVPALSAPMGNSVPDAPAIESNAGWADVVVRVAHIMSRGDSSALAQVVPDETPLIPFQRNQPSGLASLLSKTEGRLVVSARAYDGATGVSLATDLADDFRANNQLPAELRKALSPDTEARARRANATALQWVRTTLRATDTDPIGLIVFYDVHATDLPPQARLTFVLVKGERAINTTPRLMHIAFGDPLASARP